MILPQETIEQIKALSKVKYPYTVISNERMENVQRYRIGYVAGATEWVGNAQELADALKQIEQMSDTGDYCKAICDMKALASNALAKHKDSFLGLH